MGIEVLGPVQVGGVDTALGHRDRVILSALALEPGETLSPERLADALWGDKPPKSWPKVVQGSMMRLRRALGTDVIETTSGGYRLMVGDDDVDTARFERLVARGRGFAAVHEPARAATAFELALGLWRGPAFGELEGWDVGRAEATRLTEVRHATEEELVEARLAQGRPVEAVAQARRLAARQPYREHRWALLAMALYRSGRQREALDVIRRAASTLREELGLDPGPELVRLEQAILRQDPALLTVADRPLTTTVRCPYRGLRPYGSDDAESFFGRDQAVAGCLERLADTPLLVVVGPSGSGKSSLVAAGVVPALRSAGQRVILLSPGTQPMTNWSTAMASQPAPAVVVVDQLEELFTTSAEQAGPFLDALVAHTRTGAQVLATLRSDQLAGLAASPAFARLAERGLLLLTPMTETELEQAIEAPAAQDGLLLEPGLVDLLVRDVLGEPGGLPLLSHALAETWERREGNVLTVEGYTQTGGIRAAVAQSAERLYESLAPGDRAGLRTVMLRLVTPSPNGEPVAAHVPTRVFAGADDTERLLDVLVRARLVTADTDSVTIAHEALTRAWPRLRSWLDEDVEGQRVFQHLQVAADGWGALGRPEEELYAGARLQAAQEFRDRSHPVLAAGEVEFLAASEAHEVERRRREDRVLREQVRRNRQLRGALAGVVILLVIALVAGTVATNRGRTARRSEAEAEAARLGTAALVQPQLDATLLLARQAVALADNATTEGSLFEALAQQRGLVSVVHPDPSWSHGIAPDHAMLSPDGTRELINSARGVELVNVVTGRTVIAGPLVAQPADSGQGPYPAGFIDGGRTAVVGRESTEAGQSQHRELVAFSASDGHPVGSPQQVPGSASGDFVEVDRFGISSSDKVLVSMLDNAVRVWRRTDVGWGMPTTVPLPGLPASNAQYLNSITFSRDGSTVGLLLGLDGPPYVAVPYVAVAVATDPARLLLPPLLPEAHNIRPQAVAMSPDGTALAVGYDDGTVELHAVASRTAVARVPGETPVSALGWSSDGTQLVAAHVDGSLAVFDTKPLRLVSSYPKAADPAYLAGIAHNRLITQTNSGSITLRSLDGSDGLMRVQATPQRPNTIAVGPAGSDLAIGEIGGGVAVYSQSDLSHQLDLSLGPYPLPDSTGSAVEHQRVTALAITPDGKALIAADRIGHLRMWSLPQGKLLWSRTDVPTSQLTVSPDGRYLATAEFTQAPDDPQPDSDAVSTRVRIWDLATRQTVMSDGYADQRDANGNTPKPRAITFSADSTLLAVGYFRQPVVVYDVARRDRQTTFDSDATALAFSPDGKTLLVQDFSGRITGIDPVNGRQHVSLAAPVSGYASLTYTSDGRWLVGSDYTTISVWDAQSLRLVVSRLSLPSDGTSDSLALAATSNHELFVSSQTGVIKLDMDPSRWNSLACSVAGRTLTKAEWNRFLPDRPYAPACS